MKRLRQNFFQGTLASGITDSATTITSAEFAAMPQILAATDIMALSIEPEGAGPEIVWVTAHDTASTTITALRGQEGSTAAAHASGSAWRNAATVEDFKPTEFLMFALSDEVNIITAGTAKLTFRMPYAFVLTELPRSSLVVVSSSGLVTVDINEGGTSILSTKLSIDATEKTSVTAATPAVLSDSTLADDAEITVDIDAAGTGAKGLKVTLIGCRA